MINPRVLAAMEWSKANPSQGDLRVWWTSRRLGEEPKHSRYEIQSITQAALLIECLAEREVNDEQIEYNAHGLEEWDEEAREWYEWYDGDGRDINEHWEEE